MSLGARIAAVLGTRVVGLCPLQGGDLSTVTRADLADGRQVVAKTGPRARREARMLRAMAAAGAAVPRLLHAGADLLILDHVPPLAADAAGWRMLGQELARMHRAGGAGLDAGAGTGAGAGDDDGGPPAGRYGWPEDDAFGAQAIANRPDDDWPRFWARNRLLPFTAHLDARLARRIETLSARLPERLPAAPAPALLHGDLWVGNVIFARPRPVLIDPACYRGDAEVDLAMLALFGTPPAAFAAGYGPLPPGHAERRPIYQLWPALVHLRLFGAGYLGLVEGLLARCGV
ncbi:MAG: hypothetical protein Kow0058_00680 [Roseovarius sp.]